MRIRSHAPANRQRLMRAWVSTLALIVLGAGQTSILRAQGSTLQQTLGRAYRMDGLGSLQTVTTLCDIPVAERSALSGPCNDGNGASSYLQAFASFDGLKVSAKVAADGSSASLTGLSAQSVAYTQDELVFSGMVPAQLIFHLALTGDPSLSWGGDTRVSYSTELGFTASGYQGSASGFLSWVGLDGYVTTPESIAETDRSVTVVGSQRMTLNLYLNTVADMRSGYALAGNVESDFLHTGRIAFIQAFDESGTDISEQIVATSASGTNYQFGAAVTTAPEPASLLLLGTGLFAFGTITRRRRQS